MSLVTTSCSDTPASISREMAPSTTVTIADAGYHPHLQRPNSLSDES